MNLIPLFKVHMNKNAPKMVEEVLMSGMITQSKKVEEFENSLKEWFNYPYILTLNSATSGLTLAYRLLDVTEKDEVISTPLTCFATTCAILANTKKIEWVDTDPETCNIDLEDVKRNLTAETKVLSFVHWAGNPVNLDKVEEIKLYAKEKFGTDLGVVEDCAHSFGAEWRGKKLGTHGKNIAVYSLQAIKHLTTGDGGLIFLPNEEMYKRAKLLRWYGIDRERRSKPGTDFRLEPDIPEWGYKFHMNDINATIGLANIPDITGLLQKARDTASYYYRELDTCSNITVYNVPKEANPSYWIYTICVRNGLKPFFLKYMKEKNVMVSQVHARNDRHSCVKSVQKTLPQLKHVENEIVSIPCGWWVTNEEREYIVRTIRDFNQNYTPTITTLKSHQQTDYKNLLSEMNGYSSEHFITPEMFDQIFCLYVNNEMVCAAKLVVEQKLYQPVGHIEDVVTSSARRGLGFGKMLVKYVTQKALDLGCYKVILNSEKQLKQFYESCGFEVSGYSYTRRQ